MTPHLSSCISEKWLECPLNCMHPHPESLLCSDESLFLTKRDMPRERLFLVPSCQGGQQNCWASALETATIAPSWKVCKCAIVPLNAYIWAAALEVSSRYAFLWFTALFTKVLFNFQGHGFEGAFVVLVCCHCFLNHVYLVNYYSDSETKLNSFNCSSTLKFRTMYTCKHTKKNR